MNKNLLNQRMLERLEKWQKSAPKATTAAKEKKTVMQTFRPRKDYGDDIDHRDNEAWNKEFINNPIYRGYR
jgi:hypothetical protein